MQLFLTKKVAISNSKAILQQCCIYFYNSRKNLNSMKIMCLKPKNFLKNYLTFKS